MHKAKKDIYSILHSSLESIQCLRLGMGTFPFILSPKLYNRYMYICKHSLQDVLSSEVVLLNLKLTLSNYITFFPNQTLIALWIPVFDF